MKSLPNMKVGQIIILSNLALSTLILTQNTIIICPHLDYLIIGIFTDIDLFNNEWPEDQQRFSRIKWTRLPHIITSQL